MEEKNIILTDDYRRRMAGCLAFKVDATFLYVPQACREKKESGEYIIPKQLWPVFVLRGLNGLDGTLKEDSMLDNISYDTAGNSTVRMRPGHVKVETCCKGITGWRNLRDVDGAVVPFPGVDPVTKIMPEAGLACLPPALITELTNAIQSQSRLTEEEALGLE